MALFTLKCIERPSAQATRAGLRDAHRLHLDSLGDALRAAGPLLNPEGEIIGSLIFVEAKDFDEARAILANDPYSKAGLFERTEVTLFQIEYGSV